MEATRAWTAADVLDVVVDEPDDVLPVVEPGLVLDVLLEVLPDVPLDLVLDVLLAVLPVDVPDVGEETGAVAFILQVVPFHPLVTWS